MKIGIHWFSIMGSRMAANLQKQGHCLVCFNRLATKQSHCSSLRKFADSPQKLAGQVTCCSPCWLIRTRSNKQLWASMDF